ncbi:TIM barrel protein [Paenibacillus sp. J5C2022]|uniref:TIM barrel protein n=1 Tax=Paenibacillus sp. J5C2022 TaxID=2977129 RepID=UPI00397A6F42
MPPNWVSQSVWNRSIATSRPCRQALALIDEIGENNVKVHLDTYHMNIEEKSLKEAILHAGDKLGHIHLNENDWGIPGTGHLDWDGIFQSLKKIGYKGYASLECVVDAQVPYVWRRLAPYNRVLAQEGIRFSLKKEHRYVVRYRGNTNENRRDRSRRHQVCLRNR